MALIVGRSTLIRNFHTSLPKQGGDHARQMIITPSRWQWHKFKDMMHFYILLGVIPLSLLTLFVNIFVGPAKLAPIPEGYWPEHEEYHQHPITRFIVKYLHSNYQQDYEKKMHIVHYHDEIRQIRLLEKKLKLVISEKEDVKGYSYTPVLTKYHKHVRAEYEKQKFTP